MSALDQAFTIITLALGGALFFLALTVWRDNVRSSLNRVTGSLLFFAGLAPVFWALGSIVSQNLSSANPFAESWLYNLRFLWELFFPTLVVFAIAFPLNRLGGLKRRYLALLFAPHIFHVVALFVFRRADALMAALAVTNTEGVFGSLLEKGSLYLQLLVLRINIVLDSQDQIFPILNFIYAVTASILIFSGLRGVFNPTYRKQARVIFLGVVIPVGIYVLLFASEAYLDLSINLYIRAGALALAVVVFVGAFIWAVVGFQFLNLRLVVRQSMIYTISTGLLVGAYLLFLDVGRRWIEMSYGGESHTLNIAFIVLALIFFQPLSAQLDELITRLLLRSRADYRTVIEEFSRLIIPVFEPSELRGIIENSLRRNLLAESVTFAIFEDRLGEYALTPGEGFPDAFVIDRQDVFLGAIGQLRRPTLVDDLARYRATSALAPELTARGVALILPLNDADRLLGFLSLGQKVTGGKYTADDFNLLAVLSNQLVTAMTKARLYTEAIEKKRLEEELSLARQIQIELLPKKLPASPDYAIAAHSTPARMVGGDFYDVFALDERRVGIVIADASGKGMSAAMLITQIQAMLKSEVLNNNSIQKTLENINNLIVRSSSSEKFATLFYGIYDRLARTFHYSNAGHNYPIVVHPDGVCELLKAGGLIIGAFPGATYEADTIALSEGDFIFFYTDGLTETMNDDDEEYGETRLLAYLGAIRSGEPAEIIDCVIADVDEFFRVDPPQDDRTVVALKVRSHAH